MEKNIGGIIICGGKSRRFGSDKGSYLFGKKEMIRYSIDILKKFTDQIIIVGPQTIDDSSISFADDIFKNSGPMGGIHSGLIHSDFEYNLVLACDSPFTSEDIILKLLREGKKNDITIFRTPDSKYHPLTGLYHKNIINDLESHINNGDIKLTKFVLGQNHKVIELNKQDNLESFININYLDDINKYRQNL